MLGWFSGSLGSCLSANRKYFYLCGVLLYAAYVVRSVQSHLVLITGYGGHQPTLCLLFANIVCLTLNVLQSTRVM